MEITKIKQDYGDKWMKYRRGFISENLPFVGGKLAFYCEYVLVIEGRKWGDFWGNSDPSTWPKGLARDDKFLDSWRNLDARYWMLDASFWGRPWDLESSFRRPKTAFLLWVYTHYFGPKTG